jgi:hypothetical protein
MTREEKKQKRIQRAINRRKKRREIYLKRIQSVHCISTDSNVPLSIISKHGYYMGGSWYDPSSPTGYSQKCSYDAYGICQSPCNGDC